jgi:general secretion pathway protein K
MQGRFNVNSLLPGENGEVDNDSIEHFENLLRYVGADPRWARILADWIDADADVGFPDGAEDGVYLAQNPPYRTANTPISTVTELLALPGMTQEEFQRIRPYIAALPQSAPINVCTASAPVLAAVLKGNTDFGDAEVLESNRRGGCYPTRDVLEHTPGLDYDGIARLISYNSNWFRVVTAVRIGTSELTLYSLIERQSNGGGRTVIRSTGTE